MLKKAIVLSAIVVMFVGLGQAAEFTAGPKVDNPAVGNTEGVRLPNITQSTDPVTIAGGTVACGNAGPPAYTTQNQWLRRFLLNTDHSIVQQYDVTSIDWAVGTMVQNDVNLPTATVNIYGLANGGAFTYALMGAAIGTTAVPLTPADVGTFVNFPVTGSIVDPSTTDLVVEFVAPDGSTAPDSWELRVGDNANGEIGDSYIAASACGIDEPTTMTAIGFPTAMIVLTVNGNEVPVELMAFSVE